jgi:hypothetical protein
MKSMVNVNEPHFIHYSDYGLHNLYLSSNTVNLLFRRCLVKAQPAYYSTIVLSGILKLKLKKGVRMKYHVFFSFRARCSIQIWGGGRGTYIVLVCVIG